MEAQAHQENRYASYYIKDCTFAEAQDKLNFLFVELALAGLTALMPGRGAAQLTRLVSMIRMTG
jgi:hypothetical protein